MTNNKNNKKTCFIITPIGEEGSEIRRHIDGINSAVIKPVLEEKYTVSVAHEMASPGSITKQVILAIKNSDIVIANLTGNNPNVMYEVALRHCFGTAMIMIVDKETKIPTDITIERTIRYTNDASGVLELRRELEKAVEEIESKGEISESGPVYDVLRSAHLEENVLSEIKDDREKSAVSVIFERLDQIEAKINSLNTTNNSSVQEKKSPFCVYHIKAQVELHDKETMSKVADILAKKQLGMIKSHEIEDIGDNYIKIAAVGPRFFAATLLENTIRLTFKEHGVEDVVVTKQIEEIPVA